MHAHLLETVLRAELPGQVGAGDKASKARMERAHVIVLQIDFDESLPVVIASMYFDVVQHIVGEIEFGSAEKHVEVFQWIAWAFEQ
ncbi:Uncharacterised protein [Bordetella pertussis]|nr:Uncharacterised protein [Bordetella pertussis]CPK48065.1 Uncharacterised protein [Bordetella pertussis]